jgi:hypothetical protein
MGQSKRKKQLEAMGLGGQLQYRADNIEREVEFLQGTAVWQDVEMPDGKVWIALLFRPSLWEHTPTKILNLKAMPSGEGE